MNIVLVLTTGEGGIPHYTVELANALAKTHDVSVVKPTETTADGLFGETVTVYDWFENTGISWSRLASLDVNPLKVLRGTLSYRAANRISELDPDVVHFTHQPHRYLRPVIDIDALDVPVIQTRHDIFLNEHWIKRPGRDLPAEYDLFSMHTAALTLDNVLRKVTSPVKTDGFIVHTAQNQEKLRQFKPETPIEQVDHGSFSVFDYDGEVETEPNSVLFFGDLRGNKDIEQLVDAALHIADDVEDLSVVIAGSGTLEPGVREKIDENGELFEFRNEFIPNDEVGELFASSQVVAIPHKRQGGHSGTMTIAFSHGKPVVATNVGEYDELVRGNGAGFIVEPRDSTALGNSIRSLMQNDELRAAMSENSDAVGEELSWENIAKETVEFYERVSKSSLQR